MMKEFSLILTPKNGKPMLSALITLTTFNDVLPLKSRLSAISPIVVPAAGAALCIAGLWSQHEPRNAWHQFIILQLTSFRLTTIVRSKHGIDGEYIPQNVAHLRRHNARRIRPYLSTVDTAR
jgi:hypothetical protein